MNEPGWPVDRAAIAREIAQFARVPEMADDEISLRDYANANDVDWQTARSDMQRQERAGTVTVRLAYDERVRRVVRVYRRVACPSSGKSGE